MSPLGTGAWLTNGRWTSESFCSNIECGHNFVKRLTEKKVARRPRSAIAVDGRWEFDLTVKDVDYISDAGQTFVWRLNLDEDLHDNMVTFLSNVSGQARSGPGLPMVDGTLTMGLEARI